VPTSEQVIEALRGVRDPLFDAPLAEVGELGEVAIEGDRAVVHVRLPVAGYPAADHLRAAIAEALEPLDGINGLDIAWETMDEGERTAVVRRVRPDRGGDTDAGGEPNIPFNDIDSATKVLAIASGKGGVGKSSITTNLAAALSRRGQRVGVLDADIWGYSVPRMMGVSGRPVAFDDMVMPLLGHGVKVISIGFFLDSEKPVIWRGPMLHRALQQFLADVFWGELDFLLCDLPPGTGDIAISLAQMLPNADMLVVTTPQQAAQRVALRAGQTTAQTGMRVAGVIENMATFVAPDTGTEYHIFGEGGGQLLAAELDSELLGSIPIDPRLREGADDGVPLVIGHPDAPAAQRLDEIAGKLMAKKRSLVGKSLPLQF
jgi:ATP-binding protein involved in chromosome partitioning